MNSSSIHHVSLISSFLRVCGGATIDLSEEKLHNSVKSVIGICMKFIDKKNLLESCIPGTYVDWNFVEDYKHPSHNPGNMLGDSTTWMSLLNFVTFPDTDLPDLIIRNEYPPLWCILNSLKGSRVYEPNSQRISTSTTPSNSEFMTFSDACKLFIAINLEGTSSKTMSEKYISSKLNKNSFIVSSNLMSALADERHEAGVYLTTMKFLMNTMSVDSMSLQMHISHYRDSRQSQQKAWALKYVEAGKMRPSMRDVASRMNNNHIFGGSTTNSSSYHQSKDICSSSSSVSSFTSTSIPTSVIIPSSSSSCNNSSFLYGGCDGGGGGGMISTTMQKFSDSVRFPNSMSRLLKMRCYLLASQAHSFDYTVHTSTIVPRDVSASLNCNPVTFPDVGCLCNAIESLTISSAPFEELNLFRQRCFASFAINQRRGLSMTQVLHLYVAAYQKRDVWKLCWKRIYPIMSTQISKDVEFFVSTTPFAVLPFIEILKSSTPFIS